MDRALLAAHAHGDTEALISYYTLAADHAQSPDEEGFFLTQAYVFALESNHSSIPALQSRLIKSGREQEDTPPRLPFR